MGDILLLCVSALLNSFGPILSQIRKSVNYSWAGFSVIFLVVSFKKSFVSSLIYLVYAKETNRFPNHRVSVTRRHSSLPQFIDNRTTPYQSNTQVWKSGEKGLCPRAGTYYMALDWYFIFSRSSPLFAQNGD